MIIFYITSCKNGLHAFTFKELQLLQNHGITYYLGITKYNKGNFNINKKWKFTTPKFAYFLQGVLITIIKNPTKFFEV